MNTKRFTKIEFYSNLIDILEAVATQKKISKKLRILINETFADWHLQTIERMLTDELKTRPNRKKSFN